MRSVPVSKVSALMSVVSLASARGSSRDELTALDDGLLFAREARLRVASLMKGGGHFRVGEAVVAVPEFLLGDSVAVLPLLVGESVAVPELFAGDTIMVVPRFSVGDAVVVGPGVSVFVGTTSGLRSALGGVRTREKSIGLVIAEGGGRSLARPDGVCARCGYDGRAVRSLCEA